MSGIRTSIEITDRISGSLNRITASLYDTTAAFGSVDRASEMVFSTSGVQAMAQEMYSYENRIQQLESDLVHANSRLEQMEEQTRRTSQAANMLKNAFRMVGSVVATIGIHKILEASDTLAQTTARLELMNEDFQTMNGNLQTTAELQDKIYLSAQRARASYDATAGSIAKLGLLASDAFSSTDEIIAFSELMNKSFKIGGSSATEQAAAMYQLTQAMASGRLQGDEYRSIIENAPLLKVAIEDYMINVQQAEGCMKDWASQGMLTADVIKAALFGSAREINQKFEEIPMTWSDVLLNIRNGTGKAFQPVLQRINDIANSEAIENFANGAIETMATLANIVLYTFDAVGAVGTFMADNWSMISPVIYGVIAALAVYAIYLGIVKAIEIASATVKGALAVAEFVHCAAVAASTGATIAATAAQMDLNGAMYACPVVWIIILVIALIAILVLLCNWIAQVTGAANSGIGIICGALSVALAFVGNLFVGLINMIIDIFSLLWNVIAMFANFFGNVFNDPVGAIARLFFDLVDCILGLLKTLAGAIDAIFGFNLSDAVQGWRDDLGGWVDDTFGKGTEIMQTLDSKHIDRFEYGDAWKKGTEFGDGIADKISNFNLSDIFGKTDIPNPDDYTPIDYTNMGNSLDSISEDTGNISDSVDISNENLEYLRDIAERDTINRFTTAEIKVEMTNNNSVSSDMDLDGMITKLNDGVKEAMEKSAEGV